MGKEPGEISDFVMTCLKNYHFPGNVRELENIVEKGVALSKTNILLPETLQQTEAGPSACVIPPEGVSLDDIIAGCEKRYIQEALKISRGSVKGAAELLGVSFRSMRYRLKKLGIDKHDV
jgi:two-component system response regulator PilR (NtrC family)